MEIAKALERVQRLEEVALVAQAQMQAQFVKVRQRLGVVIQGALDLRHQLNEIQGSADTRLAAMEETVFNFGELCRAMAQS